MVKSLKRVKKRFDVHWLSGQNSAMISALQMMANSATPPPRQCWTQKDSAIGICFIEAHGDKKLLYSRKVLVIGNFTACLWGAHYQRPQVHFKCTEGKSDQIFTFTSVKPFA